MAAADIPRLTPVRLDFLRSPGLNGAARAALGFPNRYLMSSWRDCPAG